MKRTNIHQTILAFMVSTLALAFTTSCSDWLDVKPKSQLDVDDLYQSENGFSESLTGVYANMTETNLYGKKLTWEFIELLGGGYKAWGTTYNNDVTYAYKHDNPEQWTGTIDKIDEIWDNLYTQIANLNILLENIDGKQQLFSDDNYRIIKGEAIGLRAFLHFELLRMFGPAYSEGKDVVCIPFISELTTDVPPLLTVDQMLTLLISELQTSIELMENDPIRTGETPNSVLASLPSGNSYTQYVETYHNRRFHFNYYAAWATLARVYLWKNDRANALAAAKEVIQAQEERFPWVVDENLRMIGSNSTDNPNQDRTFATEHVFALNITKLEDHITGYLYYTGNAANLFDSDLSQFENQTIDPRLQYLYTQVGNRNVLSKFIQQDNVYSFFQERIPLIRVSEMFYIAAECEASPAEGVKWLEEVRNNRGLSSRPLPAGITAEQLQAEILKEYRREFCGEGQMWYYYKRHLAREIPNMTNFNSTSLYTFDRPEDEDLYRE